jgi:hypothetical protein
MVIGRKKNKVKDRGAAVPLHVFLVYKLTRRRRAEDCFVFWCRDAHCTLHNLIGGQLQFHKNSPDCSFQEGMNALLTEHCLGLRTSTF